MTKSDFLQILEFFPGKEKLRGETKGEKLVLEFCYIKTADIINQLKKFKNFDLPKTNEELWFKFLFFLAISTELEEETLYPNEFLSVHSREIADNIVKKFNDKFSSSTGDIIRDVAGIKLNELIEFAKNGEALL